MEKNIYLNGSGSGYTVLRNHKPKNDNLLTKVISWLVAFSKKQAVLSIAIVAMLITCLIIPVDANYLGYFNWRTIATLFCTLEVVKTLF